LEIKVKSAGWLKYESRAGLFHCREKRRYFSAMEQEWLPVKTIYFWCNGALQYPNQTYQ